MIDFTKLTGIEHDGKVVTQIEDSAGRVLWVANGGKVILEVEKITSDTYAGGTTYTGEQFILLDVYPKANGTVKVTYGGLIKTITDVSGAEKPNAQSVFFGTFNGVSDSVATPARGELTIEGDYYALGQGAWSYNSKGITLVHDSCVKKIANLGKITEIPSTAFNSCKELTSVTIPKTVVSIPKGYANNPFGDCHNLKEINVENGNEYFCSENGALFDKNKNRLISCPSFEGHYIIPGSVTEIDGNAFGPRTTSATVLATTPPDVGAAVFGGTMAPYVETITVPKGCGETYKAAEGWSGYKELIVEES